MSEKPLQKTKADELCVLLASKGYQVEHEWQIDGCHVAISKPGIFRQVVIFTQEVIADWPPRQILSLLERNNWQHVIGNNKGKKILHFTNNGFPVVD
ncbi:MAG: hypothetical protein ABSF45_27620 [Terriglobia bacterium]|jgi:hypothetical protein